MAGPAHQATLLSSSSPSPRSSSVARAREPSATSCFHLGAPGLLPAPRRRPKTLSPLPHSLLSLPSPGSLPRAHPRATVAAARRCRAQSHCPASPSCLKEPPRRPTPPRRDTRVRKPCFIPNAAVFFRGIRRSPSSLHRLQAFPEPDEHFNRRAVSLRSFSP